MAAHSTLHIGVVSWEKRDGIASLIVDTFGDLGFKEVIKFLHDAKLPYDLDVIVAYGPLGSLVPLVNQLLDIAPSLRPIFVLWMTEQLPNPNLPEWFRYAVGMVRSRMERLSFRKNDRGEWRLNPRLRWLTTRMHRFRYYGDLYWFTQQRIPFVLAVGSRWICEHLRERGFDPVEAYLGYHQDWGENLGLERDIPVVWIGKAGTNRRQHLLKRIRAALKTRGIEILMIDGVENPYIFGEERTILLNRTKIVLNIGRTQWDNNAFRYYLSASNHALIVTEPTLAHTPFRPGVHLVEAPVEQIADTISYYLTHEKERQRIVEQAHQLVTSELTLRKGVSQILKKVVVAGTVNAPSKPNELDAQLWL